MITVQQATSKLRQVPIGLLSAHIQSSNRYYQGYKQILKQHSKSFCKRTVFGGGL